MQSSAKKLNIAWFTPLLPKKSGIAVDHEFLIPLLAKKFNIDLFIDEGYKPSNNEIKKSCHVHSYNKFEKLNKTKNYDTIIYQVGNNPLHSYMLGIMDKYPGITVLHELNLSGLYWMSLINNNKRFAFLRHLLSNEGAISFIKYFKEFVKGKDLVTTNPEDYPLSKSIIKNSKAVICTNNYIKEKIKNYSKVRIKVIPLGVNCEEDYKGLSMNNAREKLKLPKDKIVISSFGFMVKNKRIPTIIKVFKKFNKKHPNSIYYIVGEIKDPNIKKTIKQLKIGNKVKVIGFVDKGQFLNYINASNFCINLRHPSMGETSQVTLMIMRQGKACLISDYEQFKEMPNDCCFKINVEKEEDDLLKKMFLLTENKGIREVIEDNAKEYVKNHSWQSAARDYEKFIKEVVKCD